MGVPLTTVAVPVRSFAPICKCAPAQVFTIAGVTRNSAGAALGTCDVHLFRTDNDSEAAQLTSDANGVYSVASSSQITHYAVAYKAGSPDVAGTTVNTLVGT